MRHTENRSIHPEEAFRPFLQNNLKMRSYTFSFYMWIHLGDVTKYCKKSPGLLEKILQILPLQKLPYLMQLDVKTAIYLQQFTICFNFSLIRTGVLSISIWHILSENRCGPKPVHIFFQQCYIDLLTTLSNHLFVHFVASYIDWTLWTV
jgi:hypothetical protein